MLRRTFVTLTIACTCCSLLPGQETVKTNRKTDKTAATAEQAAPAKKAAATKQPPKRIPPTVADFAYGGDSDRQKFDFWQAKIESVVSYPGHKDEKYGSITSFLIAKLKAR